MELETTTQTPNPQPEAAEPAPAPRRFGVSSRRRFLRQAGIATAVLPTAGGMIIAGCYEDPTGGPAKPTAAIPSGGVTTPPPSNTPAVQDHDMDAMHEAGVNQFLENITSPITEGKGGQLLEFTMDGDVKVFDLTITAIQWETTPGNFEDARAYNGMVPGPIIRATEGERVRFNVTNQLDESTVVHWHGVIVPNNQDGVPFITQPPIKPGETYTYEFTLRNHGTHMYHSHHNAMEQTNRGLLGAFIIDPADPALRYDVDIDYTMVINDTFLGYTLNGKGFPATEAIQAKLGDKLLIRYMNEGEMPHPMHLHGMPQQVVAIDGFKLAQPYFCDTVNVAPGNRYDVLVDCNMPGVWAFHCHVLSHAESSTGMFGLVTVLIVSE